MNDNNNTTNAVEQRTHIAYQVRDREDGNAFCTRIEAAWQNSDEGFNIQLECISIVGRITARAASERKTRTSSPRCDGQSRSRSWLCCLPR